jgi:hypothetical protein
MHENLIPKEKQGMRCSFAQRQNPESAGNQRKRTNAANSRQIKNEGEKANKNRREGKAGFEADREFKYLRPKLQRGRDFREADFQMIVVGDPAAEGWIDVGHSNTREIGFSNCAMIAV